MRSDERPISVRMSCEDGENVAYDLLKAIYIFKRLKSLGKSRSTVNRNLKKIRAQRQYRELLKREKPKYDNLQYIAFEHEVQLHFWDQSRHGKCPEKIHQVVPSNELPIVNIMAPYLNEPNDFDLGSLHLILDLEKFQRKVFQETQGNFWQCCELSGLVGCEEWGQIPHYWKSDEVDLTRERMFIAFFGFGFQLFLTKRDSRGGYLRFERIHKTRLPEDKKYISLEYVGDSWPEEKTKITLEDQFILRPKNYFRVLCCPNEFCDYNTNRRYNLDRHIATCSQDTVVTYKQEILTDGDIRDWCISKNAIPASYHTRDFVTFDIESVGCPVNVAISDYTRLQSLQKVVSVSITKTFGDVKDRTKVIVRSGMEEEDYRKFIEEFVEYLLKLHEDFQSYLPETLIPKLQDMYEEVEAFKQKERNYSFQQIKRFNRAIHYLEQMRRLNIFGFNSQAYDLSVLFSGLLYYAKSKKYTFDVMKRGNQIMFLRIGKLQFADCINFTSGCSLDTFSKMWGAEDAKAVFPYEKYSSISEIVNDKFWPPLLDFTSSLRSNKFQYSQEEIIEQLQYAVNHINTNECMFLYMVRPHADITKFDDLSLHKYPICLKTYVEMWVMYTKKLNDGSFNSMVDYLKYYNTLDTELLADAFKNYVNSFLNNFNLSPIGFVSLPGYAERVMWSMYDTSENKPFTFSEKFGFVNKLLRDSLKGGLSCVFKRHVEINSEEEKYSKCVHRGLNGEKFTKLIAFDANSKF